MFFYGGIVKGTRWIVIICRLNIDVNKQHKAMSSNVQSILRFKHYV